MTDFKIISWNVNGIRAIHGKGALSWAFESNAHAVCLQEIKAMPEQLPASLAEPAGFSSFFNSAERKGYSGVALYTRKPTVSVSTGINVPELDAEGRTIAADFGSFILINTYFPNGGASEERLSFKLRFYDAFLDYVAGLTASGRKVLICGDVNTAHREIDLARPRENEGVSGFLPIERQWIDRLLSAGFVDAFRLKCQEPGKYSWWDYKTRARERNIGWRLDYFLASTTLADNVLSCEIHDEVPGSDHCPVSLVLGFDETESPVK